MTDPINLIPPMRMLAERVQAYFTGTGSGTVVERGWKARARQMNQGAGRGNRVIFMPSKQDGGAGAIVNPRQVGDREVTDGSPAAVVYRVRALSDWRRVLLVSIWAYDATQPNDEGAQDDALYMLFTETQRAVQSAGFGNPVWGATNITVPPERSFGLELLAELTVQFPIIDTPIEVGAPSPAVTKP